VTVRDLESITEKEFRVLGNNPDGLIVGLFLADGTEVGRAVKRDLNAGLEALLESHWRWLCRLIDKRAGYRCEGCGEIVPLQHHHREFRSHGRKDTLENILAECFRCHARYHSRERKERRAHA